jgi:hypothetical protein
MPWSIVSCEELRPPRDVLLLRYLVQREDGERREVFVEFTGTVAATSPDTLPSPLDEVARTRGRSVIEAGADRIEPVARITVSTTGLDVIPQDGLYEPGDRVYVRDDDHWSPARILHTPASLHAAGEPPAIVRVDRPWAGEQSPIPRDAVVVMRDTDDAVKPYPYELVRPRPPGAA